MNKGMLDQQILDDIIRRIVEVAQPEKIILFGSAARGEMNRHSDVDLLVVKDGSDPWTVMGDIYGNLRGAGEVDSPRPSLDAGPVVGAAIVSLVAGGGAATLGDTTLDRHRHAAPVQRPRQRATDANRRRARSRPRLPPPCQRPIRPLPSRLQRKTPTRRHALGVTEVKGTRWNQQ